MSYSTPRGARAAARRDIGAGETHCYASARPSSPCKFLGLIRQFVILHSVVTLSVQYTHRLNVEKPINEFCHDSQRNSTSMD